MAELMRFGVAMNADLIDQFDRLIERRGYASRSEAFRDLIRRELVEEISTSANADVFGTVTLVYDHHVRLLPEKLTELQHKFFSAILSTVHVHLDHDNCLEVILVRGKASVVRSLAEALIATRGVKHGRFTVTTSGGDIP